MLGSLRRGGGAGVVVVVGRRYVEDVGVLKGDVDF